MSGTSETEQQSGGRVQNILNILMGGVAVGVLAAGAYIVTRVLAEVGFWIAMLESTDTSQFAPLGYWDYVMLGVGTIGGILSMMFLLAFTVEFLNEIGGRLREKIWGDRDE